ncbi:ABC transporter ATP-binding protein [Staphylococcus sp. SQ8-PEA]|uniref:ABC transporter ATP-binding protein n=1 Tax=Staphylococcus marylandisciuri TaxID=2981529 RepID=A0ABT2QSK1_9STAP|nr:ABC transporter ATP-binding protein [Staphylococcus marylandisciuri]MCU5746973.1 ABC transporter ATP-binding protein [Staphylococcus marylandisciuri]
MLSIENVSFKYDGSQYEVLKNITCDIHYGDFIALIGPNGSGKTTLIKLITNTLNLNQGTISLDNLNNKNPSFNKHVLYLPSDDLLPGFMSGHEYIKLMHNLYNKKLQEDTLNKLSKKLSFRGALDSLIDDYSTGMKKKLQVILSLLIDPDLLIIDETLNGMDIESVEITKKLYKKIANDQTIIIMCSHDLNLLEDLCNKCLILYSGKLCLYKSIKELNDNLTNTFKKFINSEKEA